MWLNVLILVGSLAALLVGAEMLVRGAVALARHMGVSSFFIGLTIVGFGTSTPELATGIVAALEGHSDINVGNVVGSNICNIALILGITALISPIPINTALVRNEVLIVIAVSFVPLAALLNQGMIFRWEAVLMLLILATYVWRGYVMGRRENAELDAKLEAELQDELSVPKGSGAARVWVSIGLVIAGLVMLTVASNFLVDSSVIIARSLGISELIIGLTVIAFGTSAPELLTSLIAAFRKQSDISVGNILGSNIFNILAILSISSLVSPQRVNPQVIWMDTPVMIAMSLACLPIMLSGRRISRLEGGLLLGSYVAYVLAVVFLAPRWFPPIHG